MVFFISLKVPKGTAEKLLFIFRGLYSNHGAKSLLYETRFSFQLFRANISGKNEG
jgi:hypothetical protein